MGKNILIIAIIATAGYLIGVESTRKRGKNYEDLRHQLERIWNSPEARKARSRRAKDARRALTRARKRLLA